MARQDAPWRDEELLREKYWEEGLSTTEIADEWDCGSSTIGEWLDNHGIEKRDRGGSEKNAPWKDKDTLEVLYHGEDMTMMEIADELGCHHSTIQSWLTNFGIDKRDTGGFVKDAPYKDKEWLREKYVEEQIPAREIANQFGVHIGTIHHHLEKFDIERFHHRVSEARRSAMPYPQIYHREDGQNYFLSIHRLVAYAHGMIDFEELFNENIVVHHKNRIVWDNSPENLEVMTQSEHGKIHGQES